MPSYPSVTLCTATAQQSTYTASLYTLLKFAHIQLCLQFCPQTLPLQTSCGTAHPKNHKGNTECFYHQPLLHFCKFSPFTFKKVIFITSRKMQPEISFFLNSTSFSWEQCRLLSVLMVCSFLLPNDIPLHGCTRVTTIHRLKN